MKKKYLLFIAAFMLFMPTIVCADSCEDCPHSYEEIDPWIENIISFKTKGDVKYVEIPIVALPEPDMGYDANTLALAVAEHLYERHDDSIDVTSIDLENKTITFYIRYMSLYNQNNTPTVGDSGPSNDEYDPNKPIYMFKMEERTYPYELLSNYDNDTLADANSILSTLESSYSITDLATINLSWNYGVANIVSTYRDNYTVLNSSQSLLYSFQDIKNLMNANPEYQYEVKIIGDYSSLVESGVNIELILKKDNVVYATRVLDLSTDYYFLVDKDAEGTVEEKVRNRLANYLGSDVDFYIKPYVTYETYMDGNTQVPLHGFYLYFGKDSDEIHQFYTSFCNHDEEYCIDTPFVTNSNLHNNVGDSMMRPYYIMLVAEVDGSKIKDVEVNALDGNTGIEIETGSYEVPLDTLITSEDLKNAQNIISILNKYNYDMIDAYNIELYGYGNGNKIKQISNGVVVFIPIKGYKEGDVITIRHINDDGTLGEQLSGTVVSRNGKLYAKFTTTHFSTYAIVQDNTTNPDTGDNIISYVLMFILSTFGIIGTGIYLKKE